DAMSVFFNRPTPGCFAFESTPGSADRINSSFDDGAVVFTGPPFNLCGRRLRVPPDLMTWWTAIVREGFGLRRFLVFDEWLGGFHLHRRLAISRGVSLSVSKPKQLMTDRFHNGFLLGLGVGRKKCQGSGVSVR